MEPARTVAAQGLIQDERWMLASSKQPQRRITYEAQREVHGQAPIKLIQLMRRT